MVPPAIAENPAEVASQLTDDVWLIINGEKGSGKTSYLYYTRHELRTSSVTSIPLYVAFDSEDIKSDVRSAEERSAFLISYFYRPLVREIISFLDRLPRRSKQTEALLSELIDSLGLPEKDAQYLARMRTRRSESESSGGFIGWLMKLFGRSSSPDLDQRRTHSSEDVRMSPRPDQEPESEKIRSPDFVLFKETLLRLVRSVGAQRAYLLIDEVNEQRLSVSQQEALFDHLYNTYRTSKDAVTVKLAKTSSVSIPDFIFHGHYFMPMELSSMLIHPYEYEEMLRSIFEARLAAIRAEHPDDLQEISLSNFFTENSFHALAQASMGNVREFFFLSKMAYNQSLPEGKIEYVHAQRVIRSRASELEERIKDRGGDSLNDLYLHLTSILKERSEAKIARAASSLTLNEESEGAGVSTVQPGNVDSSAVGVSYFTISNYDSLPRETRELLDKLEEEKIIFGTNEWKSLRRKGSSASKQQLYVMSYLICMLRGIKWHDVSDLVRRNGGTEREFIDQHRCQISI